MYLINTATLTLIFRGEKDLPVVLEVEKKAFGPFLSATTWCPTEERGVLTF